MNEKLKAIAHELERHITEDGCACCRSEEYLQQLKDVLKEGDRISELERAIEAMRVAGGSAEFQTAFDAAKALVG